MKRIEYLYYINKSEDERYDDQKTQKIFQHIQRYKDVPFSLIDRAKIFMIYVCSQRRTKNRPRSGKTVMTVLYSDIH